MIEEKKEPVEACHDPHRAAYMIAWRDRYIERLQERLAGREEENEMLSTLLFYGLFGLSKEQASGERAVLIPTAAVAELLGSWKCHAVCEGESYAVHFTPRSAAEEPHAKESDQG